MSKQDQTPGAQPAAEQIDPAAAAQATEFFAQLTAGAKAPEARKAAKAAKAATKAAAQASVDARRAAKGLPVGKPGATVARESGADVLYTVVPAYLEKAMGMRYEHAALAAVCGTFGREDFVATLAATMATPEYAAVQLKEALRTEGEARLVFNDLKRAGVFVPA